MRQERCSGRGAFWLLCWAAKARLTWSLSPVGCSAWGRTGTILKEGPAHQVSIDGFWIDRTPVTNRQFKKFVRSERGNANHLASVAGGLFLQGQDKGGNIVDGRSAERQLRHARMRRQNEMGEAIVVEARRLSDRSKGRCADL
jgi:formylglycine-generating enzyme required for sulfatase activity